MTKRLTKSEKVETSKIHVRSPFQPLTSDLSTADLRRQPCQREVDFLVGLESAPSLGRKANKVPPSSLALDLRMSGTGTLSAIYHDP